MHRQALRKLWGMIAIGAVMLALATPAPLLALDATAIGGAPSVAPGTPPLSTSNPPTSNPPSSTPPAADNAANPAADPNADSEEEPTLKPSESCQRYVGLTHRMAGCLRDTIDSAAAKFFAQVHPFLKGAIGGVLTFAVIVYGTLLGFGMVEKVGRDTFVLLLKIAAVSAFVANSPLIFKTVTQAMDGAAVAVVSYTPPSGATDNAGTDISQSVCTQTLIEQQEKREPGKPIIGPWLGIDCLLDTVIGIKVATASEGGTAGDDAHLNKIYENSDPKKNGQGMARSLLFFFFSSLQTSILGIVLGFVGFFFIYGVIMMVIRAFFVYISGYMGVALLVILSPLFIPMVLFKETKQYFDKFTKLLISFALQPVIMLVFLIFALTAVDLAVFSGNYSIMYRIAGDASRQKGFSLNHYLVDNGVIADTDKTLVEVKAANAEPAKVKPEEVKGALISELQYNANCADKEKIAADKTGGLAKLCAKTYPVSAKLKKVDWDKMAAARKPAPVVGTGKGDTPGRQISREVLSALFFACMVVFVMNGLLSLIPSIATDLLGDVGQSPNLNQKFASPLAGAASGLQSGISNLFGKARR